MLATGCERNWNHPIRQTENECGELSGVGYSFIRYSKSYISSLCFCSRPSRIRRLHIYQHFFFLSLKSFGAMFRTSIVLVVYLVGYCNTCVSRNWPWTHNATWVHVSSDHPSRFISLHLVWQTRN